MTTIAFAGGCLCGSVRYTIAADPLISIHCQCRACQFDTGSGHMSGLAFPIAAMKIEGMLTEFSRPADSGGTATKGFCPRCGTPVTGRTSIMPDVVMVRVGTLDDPSRFTPQMLVFAGGGHAWDQIDPSLPRFPGMPPMGLP